MHRHSERTRKNLRNLLGMNPRIGLEGACVLRTQCTQYSATVSKDERARPEYFLAAVAVRGFNLLKFRR